ncbi:hypothetical protein [Microbacterium sp. RG1]|uniref:hypothetical protein n=1 Tax=Microbacterium sp. RG1 TaxID=2489212 RepID=UPI0010CA3526|nr:hypothetical protein [Microbacterium sp. RG1]QCQ16995.1 hypothetical protein EHF32_09835 [Microbacterium sp. RG1]
MSAKHQTREYQRNAKVIRARVRVSHKRQQPVPCWRGGGPIMPGQPYDVGHLPGARASALHELAPEHRHATPGCCRGNRAHGGAEGAAITNAKHRPKTVTGPATSWPI